MPTPFPSRPGSPDELDRRREHQAHNLELGMALHAL